MGDPFVTAMESALQQLAGLDEQVRGPWPHQQRDLLQWAIQILKQTCHQRLQSEAYPSEQQFINDCCANASAFLKMMEGWGCDWRVAYAAAAFFFFSFGQLEAAEKGTYENWEDGEHPAQTLLFCRPEVNQLARTIIANGTVRPRCRQVKMYTVLFLPPPQ
jgi:hypothetical protein